MVSQYASLPQKEAGNWRALFEEAAADLGDLFGELGQDYGDRPVQDGVKLHAIGQFQNALSIYGKAIAYRRDDGHLMNLYAMALLEAAGAARKRPARGFPSPCKRWRSRRAPPTTGAISPCCSTASASAPMRAGR